ncbi:uncharacterized protein LOC103708360 [Phoenix dactylifera]|uniref:Uncharacterized protein LOC103708360 n=1 Tax=Phoenix dactylifera TaxID=42345 RepID=A0A8B7C4C5_PHODC|nr:uncharacterized protein LOC103708360 [Phoenix dactylifera]
MPAISTPNSVASACLFTSLRPSLPATPDRLLAFCSPPFSKYPFRPQTLGLSLRRRKRGILVSSKASAELSPTEEEWLRKLPDRKKPLYSHSLPCIEAWLKNLGFYQSREDRAVWFVEKDNWHAQLSLDVTDLYIRYLKSGPGDLEKDVERRFSYALSREDIENAILGGP